MVIVKLITKFILRSSTNNSAIRAVIGKQHKNIIKVVIHPGLHNIAYVLTQSIYFGFISNKISVSIPKRPYLYFHEFVLLLHKHLGHFQYLEILHLN